jgi:hypothetical protein
MKAITFPTPAQKSRRTGPLPWITLFLALASLFPSETPAKAQENAPKPRKTDDQYLRIEPKRVFRLESEAELRERMTNEAQLGINPLNLKYEIMFPDYPGVPKEKLVARNWPPMTEIVEPPYACYRRLYFEQINSERYGWDLGVVSPILSQGAFYFDLLALPYHAAVEPVRRYECNAGYYLPGDPVPLMLYPLEFSWSGLAAEAAVAGLAVVLFP